ncbi:TrbI/VirB10 family protein [Nostoc sp. FACHB-145]|uniref:TrbI/VirB10 family protein n=1 Tax=Nostoc sp. FACHB-145 TaxID=2692836 RepID=UPI0016875853|nr:TrbI/VirB10 family protein [Nostoc sp. FACHB-145]MBD2473331.1 hypothetical protein [Nostoc sp. FACHB-145]
MTSENQLTVDEILKLDEEPSEISSNTKSDDIEDAEFLTQHTVVTSPWSRIGIIGVPLGVGFLIFYFMFNNIINGQSSVKKPEANPQDKSAQLTPDAENKDGDVYAQLALSRQQEELEKIKQQKEKLSAKVQPSPTSAKPIQREPSAAQVPSRPTPPVTYSSPRRYQPATRTQIAPRRSFALPRVSNPGITRVQKTVDPIDEFNRLRSIGSYGLIAYADSSVSELTLPDPADTSSLQTNQVQPQPIDIDSESTSSITEENTSNRIEKIRPRWQVEAKTTTRVNLASSYLPQESQILTERKTRYLSVGEEATGILVTPLVKQQTSSKNNQSQKDDGRRFAAKLTQDLRDNYGEVAIPKGTLLAVELVGVDGGNYATANVRSIIKDNMEFSISAGAISVQGEKGKPLIAKKFFDKGGAIASYDITVGLVGGLAKVGEIINQPDSQSTINNSSIGSFSSAVTQNNRRNIAGAFLEGAFGSVGDILSDRAARSTQEILSRPNVWHIPQGTKVTFIVNRSLELP